MLLSCAVALWLIGVDTLGRIESSQDCLRFFALGDWGSSSVSKVALAMAAQSLNVSAAGCFAGPASILMLGDNFYEDGLKSAHDPKVKSFFLNNFDVPAFQNTSFSVVAGNHDHRGKISAELSKLSPQWYFPSLYYSRVFSRGEISVLFVFIDTWELVGGESWVGGAHQHVVDSQQLQWLKTVLNVTDYTFKVVVGHYPIHSVREDTSGLVKDLLPILVSNQVDLYLHGHDHLTEIFEADGLTSVGSGVGGGRQQDGHLVSGRGLVWSSIYSLGFVDISVDAHKIYLDFYEVHQDASTLVYSFTRHSTPDSLLEVLKSKLLKDCENEKMSKRGDKVAFIEPYYGGSHRLLIEILSTHFSGDIFTMRPKKWHWRMRSAALSLSQSLPDGNAYRTLFVSSMLNLAELLALRPDYATIPRKVMYVHENQFEYPKQYEDKEERDYYFLHASLCSCLAADIIAWNSKFNLESFLNNLPKLNAMLPIEADCKPDLAKLSHEILSKSFIVPVPIDIPSSLILNHREGKTTDSGRPLRIGWPHRWEHDKNPDEFLRVLNRLCTEVKVPFTVIVFGGETFEGTGAYDALLLALNGEADRIEGCGRIENRYEYLSKLQSCDVVVSTAIHEFFGIAMTEAARLGCRVLCPKRLSYPELFREDCLYTTETKLFKLLREYCLKPGWVQRSKPFDDFLAGTWARLSWDDEAQKSYARLLYGDQEVVSERNSDGNRIRLIVSIFMFIAVCWKRS